ncbi:LacI family DNA-binding transcriptional regulator [Galbitalea sp. SE-J8]|uniref:LacI family DNA-binding transcriptional regulator n=1 Tax=Galbitalea sp. SE-J8 TaxID=3054952 RepID=UPI00259CB882|nr:LacI family DNA-binding transcriptional regulator [Galbitalea sp. SE-J8]MDM4762498.1 LacI family DNA-binding transcriptional regulator [Galbitalea sp. SE-J8]
MPPDAELSPVSGRTTIHDVARAAGVSVATVSKVINGRYGVAASTFSRVMTVVSELGYESSLVASSLRRSKTNVLGILVAEFEPFSTELLKAVSAAMYGTDYELLAYSGPNSDRGNVGWERRSLSRLAGTLIDGAIIVTPTVTMSSTSIPVVTIDPHTGRGGPASIGSDNVAGAYTATRHLIELGHRRIAHISGRRDLESAELRELGYRRALEDAGIPYDPALVRDGNYRAPQTDDAARALLTMTDRPTAIFAANDQSAIRVLEIASELGIRVPGDLSVVGFDNIPEASAAVPQLTTMAQPLREMGAEALRMLLALLGGTDTPQHVQLHAELVVRGSTGPAPTG